MMEGQKTDEKGPERTVVLTFLFLLIFKDDAKSMPL